MPRNTARHRLILDMIEAALRAAGAPVYEIDHPDSIETEENMVLEFWKAFAAST